MLLPTPAPKKKKGKGGQPSPYTLFFAAFLAYIFGAPIGFSLFLAGLGIIFWRVQASARSMDKLPPLPPMQPEADAGPLSPNSPNSPSSPGNTANPGVPVPPPLEQTTWGRVPETAPKPPPTPVPWQAPEQQTDASPVFRDELPRPVPPEPMTQPTALVSTTSPLLAPDRRRDHRDAVHAYSMTRRRPGDGLDFASPAGLRRAVVAMTVLGPCRALEPYRFEPTDRDRRIQRKADEPRPRPDLPA